MDESNSVNLQITDGVTQTTCHVVGMGPAMAAVTAYLGQAQSQMLLYANMVNQQQQQSLTALTATTRCVGKLMKAKRGSAQAARMMGASASAQAPQTSMQAFAMNADRQPQHPHPVVT